MSIAPRKTLAALLLTLALTGCGGGDSNTNGGGQPDKGGADSNLLSISQVESSKGAVEDACETVLGSPEELAQYLDIDPAQVWMGDDGWEGGASYYWNEDDPDEVITSIECPFTYLPDGVEHDEATSDDEATINIIFGRSGEDAAWVSGTEFHLNGGGVHKSISVSAEGDGVVAGAKAHDPTNVDNPEISDEQLETFLNDEVLPKIAP